jgi:hypothetical protein
LSYNIGGAAAGDDVDSQDNPAETWRSPMSKRRPDRPVEAKALANLTSDDCHDLELAYLRSLAARVLHQAVIDLWRVQGGWRPAATDNAWPWRKWQPGPELVEFWYSGWVADLLALFDLDHNVALDRLGLRRQS